MDSQLIALSNFLPYWGAALTLTLLFIRVYVRITPYDEIALIRTGNQAAAFSLAGAVLGFVVPLSSAIAHSVSFVDMLVWGGVALLAQLLVYAIVRFAFLPEVVKQVETNQIGAGVLLGGLSLGFGILTAACFSY
ncbi:DUF350 domain-containing protein [Parachitinimonas caeni]|uniref:DUF350 domain-containing protein n=1 Tax=Parachitinimonas caeni TaxID=3031301 RepID=A0ABT7DS30_9NEIS|nr:DUF350 domain-containing protein [Parachitinimonas caeni]MDK2122861.1 DUF350 domain-containing protein [Parachitinimonas caeni]